MPTTVKKQRRKLKQQYNIPRLFTSQDKLGQLVQAYEKGLIATKPLDLDEWSDLYRVLPKETSAEYGKWKTSRFPFLKKIMKALSSSSRAKEIVGIKGAQLGFTELCINWFLYTADHDPTPFMYVQKTKDAAEDFSTQKLAPGIEICKKVHDTLGPGKPKSLSNTVYNKGFPGGFGVFGGANSGAFLRSKSIDRACIDEEDSMSSNVDQEGSPVYMVRKRQSNFPDSKLFRLSTPKIKETSTIEPAYFKGSQEQYYVPCPHCNPHAKPTGQYDTIRWKNITWEKDTNNEPILDSDGVPTNIALVCEGCGELIEEHSKTWMLEHGEWMSVKGLDKNDPTAKPYIVGDVEFPTFQINSLYSPDGFFSWRDAVIEWFNYQQTGDKGLLQGFVNQTLGETYSLAGQQVSHGILYDRREKVHADYDIPYGGLCVTGSVDVQEDRLEAKTIAWGLNDECWVLDYHIIYGSTDTVGDKNGRDAYGNLTAWHLLGEFLEKRYRHQSGNILSIECTAVDSGYRSDPVHIFCKNRQHLRIFPIKGADGWGNGYIERPKRVNEKYHTWDFKLWVDEIKDRVYSQLNVKTPGVGYVHFPKKDVFSEKYFQGLTAESKEVVVRNGKKKLIWVCPPGVRNEPLDLFGYALAAIKIYAPNLEARAQRFGPGGGESNVGMESYRTKVVGKKTGSKNRSRRGSRGIKA